LKEDVGFNGRVTSSGTSGSRSGLMCKAIDSLSLSMFLLCDVSFRVSFHLADASRIQSVGNDETDAVG